MNIRYISADYFRTLGIPLLRGRVFEEGDRKRKVAVISERLARALWPGQDPLGRRFARNENDEFEVIGVVGDVRADVDKPLKPMVYQPNWEEWWTGSGSVVLVARAAGDPWSIAGAMRSAIRGADADIPVSAMRTMRQVLEASVAQRRFQMLLVSAFAATALLLASLGIYGVVSYSVARHTNELGLRVALGAQPSDLYRLVLRQGMRPVVAGLLAGIAAALALGRVFNSLLYELSAHDPLTLAVVVVVLLLVALVACYFPARRAARLNPMEALRYE